MSTAIIGRIDEMGGRIDDLEKSIAELMQQVSNLPFPLTFILFTFQHRPVLMQMLLKKENNSRQCICCLPLDGFNFS